MAPSSVIADSAPQTSPLRNTTHFPPHTITIPLPLIIDEKGGFDVKPRATCLRDGRRVHFDGEARNAPVSGGNEEMALVEQKRPRDPPDFDVFHRATDDLLGEQEVDQKFLGVANRTGGSKDQSAFETTLCGLCRKRFARLSCGDCRLRYCFRWGPRVRYQRLFPARNGEIGMERFVQAITDLHALFGLRSSSTPNTTPTHRSRRCLKLAHTKPERQGHTFHPFERTKKLGGSGSSATETVEAAATSRSLPDCAARAEAFLKNMAMLKEKVGYWYRMAFTHWPY